MKQATLIQILLAMIYSIAVSGLSLSPTPPQPNLGLPVDGFVHVGQPCDIKIDRFVCSSLNRVLLCGNNGWILQSTCPSDTICSNGICAFKPTSESDTESEVSSGTSSYSFHSSTAASSDTNTLTNAAACQETRATFTTTICAMVLTLFAIHLRS